MAVTAPADKRYNRAHLKPSRKHAGWIAKRWRVFAVALAVAAGGFVAQRALTSFTGLPVFQVRRIAVHGDEGGPVRG